MVYIHMAREHYRSTSTFSSSRLANRYRCSIADWYWTKPNKKKRDNRQKDMVILCMALFTPRVWDFYLCLMPVKTLFFVVLCNFLIFLSRVGLAFSMQNLLGILVRICALCHYLSHGFYDQLSSLRKEISQKGY